MTTYLLDVNVLVALIDPAFPLELKVPNAETLAAMEESRAMMSSAGPALRLLTNCLPILKKTAASKHPFRTLW